MSVSNGTTVAALRLLLQEERRMIETTALLAHEDPKEFERLMAKHSKRIREIHERAQEVAEVKLTPLD